MDKIKKNYMSIRGVRVLPEMQYYFQFNVIPPILYKVPDDYNE